jgi:hypothetical protein
LEQADKQAAMKRTTMEPNNFSDLIFPDPFAKHEFECQVAQAHGQVCRYRSFTPLCNEGRKAAIGVNQ